MISDGFIRSDCICNPWLVLLDVDLRIAVDAVIARVFGNCKILVNPFLMFKNVLLTALAENPPVADKLTKIRPELAVFKGLATKNHYKDSLVK
jgi:hypothetical protein